MTGERGWMDGWSGVGRQDARQDGDSGREAEEGDDDDDCSGRWRAGRDEGGGGGPRPATANAGCFLLHTSRFGS